MNNWPYIRIGVRAAKPRRESGFHSTCPESSIAFHLDKDNYTILYIAFCDWEVGMSHSKAGFYRVCIVLFFVISLALAACTQATPSTNKSTLSSDPVIRWIQQNAISLRTVNPGGSDTDLIPFQKIVGSASIVGLGEATHGPTNSMRSRHASPSI